MKLRDYVGNRAVSTVRLTIDHGFGGQPRWYETMVFPAEGEEITSFDELYCDRYETEAEALAGHAEVVARLRIDPHCFDGFVSHSEGETVQQSDGAGDGDG